MARTTPVNSGYTIINGSGTGSNGNRIDVWLEYKLGTQNVTGNYTPITVYFYAALNPSYTSTTSATSGLNSTLTVDGKSGSGVSNGSYDFTSSSVVNLLGGYSGNISHNTDGAKSVVISGSFTTKSTYISGGSVSATITLPTIARASAIGATAANIGEVSSISISRKSTSYTHSIKFAFGNLSGYVKADGTISATEVKISTTSIAFAVPETFYAQIPNAKSGTCTLTCTTYSGSAQIGSAQKTAFKATAAKDECAPYVAGEVVDANEKTIAVTGDENVLVRYVSNALCTITAEAKNSATISSKAINGVTISGDTKTISAVETGAILFKATDSRGYATSVTVNKTLIPYAKLTANATLKRNDPTSGKATLSVTGNYYNGSFGAENNALSVKYRVKQSGGTYEEYQAAEAEVNENGYTLNVDLTGLDYSYSWIVEVVVSDALSSVTKTPSVGKGIPVFDWGENDFRFNVPVSVDEIMAGSETYKPYFCPGDTVNISYLGAGYVTSSSKNIYFTVPLVKPIIGVSTIDVASDTGFILRQNNAYTHGSAAETRVFPSSYAITKSDVGLRVRATFGDITNATNNDAIGINWEATLELS